MPIVSAQSKRHTQKIIIIIIIKIIIKNCTTHHRVTVAQPNHPQWTQRPPDRDESKVCKLCTQRWYPAAVRAQIKDGGTSKSQEKHTTYLSRVRVPRHPWCAFVRTCRLDHNSRPIGIMPSGPWVRYSNPSHANPTKRALTVSSRGVAIASRGHRTTIS